AAALESAARGGVGGDRPPERHVAAEGETAEARGACECPPPPRVAREPAAGERHNDGCGGRGVRPHRGAARARGPCVPVRLGREGELRERALEPCEILGQTPATTEQHVLLVLTHGGHPRPASSAAARRRGAG